MDKRILLAAAAGAIALPGVAHQAASEHQEVRAQQQRVVGGGALAPTSLLERLVGIRAASAGYGWSRGYGKGLKKERLGVKAAQRAALKHRNRLRARGHHKKARR